VKGARDHLIRSGRVVGGTVPYGWRSIPNPDGPGFVLAQDPERITYVRGMAERALRGETVYAICRWLDSKAAPLPTASQKSRKRTGWNYASVERLLRSPILAGMTPHQPGRKRHDPINPLAVLRDANGLPVVDESVAVLTTEERRRLLDGLDNRETPQARPRASRGATSPLLSRLVVCGHCEDRTMHRGTTQRRPSLSCPTCHQTVSRTQLDEHIIERLMVERGHLDVWERVDITQDTSPELADVEQAIKDCTEQLAQDEADVSTLMERLTGLKALRSKARRQSPKNRIWRVTGRTVEEAWKAAADDVERREVLMGQVARLAVMRGRVGRYLDPARVVIAWQPILEGMPLPDRAKVKARLVEPVPGQIGLIGPVVTRLGPKEMVTVGYNDWAEQVSEEQAL
jgi:hypothetical protein